jgi:hypothetical protein
MTNEKEASGERERERERKSGVGGVLVRGTLLTVASAVLVNIIHL